LTQYTLGAQHDEGPASLAELSSHSDRASRTTFPSN